jgi:hypothetical protein
VRAAMAGVEAPWPAMGSSPERGKRGEGRGERGGAAMRLHAELLGAPWGGAARSSSLLVAALCVSCFLCEKKKTAGRRREEREKKNEKRKKKKRKKMGKFVNMEIFGKIK